MFELLHTLSAPPHPADPFAPAREQGKERRAGVSLVWRWLAATLDEIDYGMLLLGDDAHVVHANHAARAELDARHPLQLLGRQLRARRMHDVAVLHEALAGASQRGLRKLLAIGGEGQRVVLSIVPLPALGSEGRNAALVMLGKRQVCEALSVQGYARTHGLTSAEARVLAALCNGVPPVQIAAELDVAISTVRTHITNIRMKTGAGSIRALVRQVAVLPPLMGVLRRGAGYDSFSKLVDVG